MNKYKILWIDDQYELLSELMERCEVINGFEITKCRFAKEGMKTFESHLEEWSAVVLDAKVLMESLNEVPNLSGLRYCRDRINELKPRRYVPMFVFTGQPDLISNEMFENMVDKYYSKGDDDDQLIKDIISAADQQEETQIIHKHQTVFDAWPESKHDLLRILKVLENEDWQNNSVLNDIRKIMSDVMNKLYVRGFCSVKHDGSNLGACSYVLGQRYMEEIIPVHVQRCIHSLVDVTNPGSHRTKIDSDVASGKAPYLIRTLIYEMLNVLCWGKVLNAIDDPEKVKRAIDIAKYNYEKKVEERKNKKKQQ
jgi:hypothetical protein